MLLYFKNWISKPKSDIVHVMLYAVLTLMIIFFFINFNIIYAVAPIQKLRTALDVERDFAIVLLHSTNVQQLLASLQLLLNETPIWDKEYRNYLEVLMGESALYEGLTYLSQNDNNPLIVKRSLQLLGELDKDHWFSPDTRRELLVFFIIGAPILILVLLEYKII